MPTPILGFERPRLRAEQQLPISKLRKARLERIALHGLAMLSMGSVLTALIALRTAIHMWHLQA
ncbi:MULTISPECIES: hypothetical protein [unclassified Bradyrhizobium]|uniref:hypothetical protein n=1 Tax=unclassified Bradyrhizobium TaxID=2631580 RepID=UPI001CD1B971|nr:MULTISPECIES: hypothetical protein [unclassified Bradyrhizobium]MCA1426502.1 hypothetical protein [Bradyrhizobium sp. NBAIM16]MCA1495502.1 hypothetical protein [Bradyrhizobium sp. NBAIM14]MCA1505288.1 hypothetical protein [Bradyrhizobium sp. NBAIM02]MCA1547300.1 hypothetical protein [Bradyrhizobium sp. BRP19]